MNVDGKADRMHLLIPQSADNRVIVSQGKQRESKGRDENRNNGRPGSE